SSPQTKVLALRALCGSWLHPFLLCHLSRGLAARFSGELTKPPQALVHAKAKHLVPRTKDKRNVRSGSKADHAAIKCPLCPRKRTWASRLPHVRFVPEADIRRCYSITWSAHRLLTGYSAGNKRGSI